MEQSKLESLLEAVVNTAVGFVVSLALWRVVGPMMGYEVSMTDNLIITTIFTVVSIGRGFVMRRIFNAGLHRAIHSFARRIYVRHTTN